jgi:ribose transport system ATP-binding protein
VDVASRAEIYRVIDQLAQRKKGLIVVSSSLSELVQISDRIAVMRRGRLGPARPARELDEQSLLAEATGS